MLYVSLAWCSHAFEPSPPLGFFHPLGYPPPFVNTLATLFFYQKSLINKIVNKIRCIYWFNYKTVTGSQRKTILNFTQINSWCINCNQYIQNTIKNKLRMKGINYACFKPEEKATRNVKKKKNNFINAIRDKFAMSIRWGKLTISFRKFFSCINYHQLLK